MNSRESGWGVLDTPGSAPLTRTATYSTRVDGRVPPNFHPTMAWAIKASRPELYKMLDHLWNGARS
jgi:hypothetical protein